MDGEHTAIPTIVEHLQSLVARRFGSQLESPLSVKQSPTIAGTLSLFEVIGRVLVEGSRMAPSQGYEPLLEDHGWPTVPARLLAKLIVRHGTRESNDARREPIVRNALKALSNPGIKQLAKTRRIEELLAAWRESHAVEAILDAAGLDVFEMIHLLEDEQQNDGPTHSDIVRLARLAVKVPARRGPKVTPESAAHDFFLRYVRPDLKIAVYSWSELAGGCNDPASRATMREFNLPRFDARPAVRRTNRAP